GHVPAPDPVHVGAWRTGAGSGSAPGPGWPIRCKRGQGSAWDQYGPRAGVPESFTRTGCPREGGYTGARVHSHLRKALSTSVAERIAESDPPISLVWCVPLSDAIRHSIHMVDEITCTPSPFFDILTVLASPAVVDTPLDVAVVGVGVGERCDATAVVDADAEV